MVELTAVEASAERVTADALEEHGPLLLAAARLITLDDDEAHDLVQTTFEIALRRVDSLRDPAALRTWLLRIQTREAFRMVRRLRRLVRLRLPVHDRPDPAPGPADLVGQADLRQALATLPTRIRAAIVLHYLAGLSVRATAAAMGVSENTVKTQLRAGLARLREALDDG